MGGSAQGGSANIDFRNPDKEWPTISDWYGNQTGEFNKFVAQYPLLQQAQAGALDFFKNLPTLTDPLQNLYGSLPSIQPTISSLQNQFGGLPHQLQAQFGAIPKRLMELTPTLTRTARGYLTDVIGSQGALSPEASREAAQYARTVGQGQYGTESRQMGNFANEILNRQAAREARYNTALGQYNAATGQISALDQAAQGLGTNLAQVRQGLGLGLAQGIQGLRSSDIAQRTGLAGAIQNLQSGGLNQLNTTAANASNVFAQTTNPILSYLGNLFSNNLQGSIAQAQINQQGNIANDNKTAGLIGGALSSIGSVAGAAAMSDERVKEKIKETGLETEAGPLKTWEYKTKPGVRYLGHMAQDVEKRLPDRVLTDPLSGIKMVVGLPIIQISPPERKVA